MEEKKGKSDDELEEEYKRKEQAVIEYRKKVQKLLSESDIKPCGEAYEAMVGYGIDQLIMDTDIPPRAFLIWVINYAFDRFNNRIAENLKKVAELRASLVDKDSGTEH